jgi:hypothetical protein
VVRAFVTRLDPSAVGTGIQAQQRMAVVDIMNTEDVDSGEAITFAAPDLFNGRFGAGRLEC